MARFSFYSVNITALSVNAIYFTVWITDIEIFEIHMIYYIYQKF